MPPDSDDDNDGIGSLYEREQFTDDWDQAAFDPDGPTEPLEHFEDMVREV